MKCFVLLLDYHIVTSAALTGRAGGNGFNVSKKNLSERKEKTLMLDSVPCFNCHF